ncbi:MAG: hypothetical protein HC878_03145 [Leptolyngbyaceae cyanobacterium SL_5_14]|nr:hypothetical protein [Leptolyngbyaceae cyanobacterium SL_5_14]
MFSTLAERYVHLARWGLAIAWLALILSMFYDPVSAQLTAPNSLFAASTVNGCFQFQGECIPLSPYPMGARIFWGMVVPLSIIILLVFGHEAWRRICPLSFMSQIPRALGWQQKRVVSEASWLDRNALYLQFGLLFVGLNLRLLLVNSDRFLLGTFLLLTILSAIAIGFLYDGKTWCNYFCPMAPVQMIYSEPSGLLGSEAHTAPPKTITQSMCRTVIPNGQEKSACVACKLSCIDIDAEAAHWDSIRRPDRKLVYYSYVGLVIGFYLYFWLYSGSWNFLSAGVWNETNQLATLMSPGFFIAGRAIAIPKLLAVPLTLTVTSWITYAIGLWVERHYKRRNKRLGYPLSVEQVQSRMFAVTTFLAFNLLFFMGVRPTLGYFPLFIQQILSWGAVVASSLWLVKSWNRSAQQYNRERDANLLRRQLSKLDIDFSQSLDGRSLEDLKPDELYALAKVLPGFTQDYRLQVYTGVVREALEQGSVTLSRSLGSFQPLRQNLEISEDTHWIVLDRLQTEEPTLFYSPYGQSRSADSSVLSPEERRTAIAQPTVYKSANRNPAAHRKTKPSTRNTKHTSDADATLLNFTPQDETDSGFDTSNSPKNHSDNASGETTMWRPESKP